MVWVRNTTCSIKIDETDKKYEIDSYLVMPMIMQDV